MRSRFPVLLLVFLTACAPRGGAPPPLEAQSPPAGDNSPAPAAAPTPSTRDGVYTAAQAERGGRVFEANCAQCHGRREFTGSVFQLTWSGQTLGAIYTRVRTTMPLDNPGRLSAGQYADVVAYMLSLNGYPAGERELVADADVLAGIRFERMPDP